ncbi:MAG: hypothetical protein ACR2NB_09465 [Solirubrobacteraceae bacterium]
MALWWIGNIILLAVIAPVVVFLLRGVLKAASTVRRTVADVAAVGTAMVADLEPVPQLLETQRSVSQATAGLVRYGAALDEIL